MTSEESNNNSLSGIDDIDRGILHLLQQDARRNTTSKIGESVGVSSSTVGNRINRLEERGIITGYQPTLDYEQRGFDQHLLLSGTVPLEELESKAGEILDVRGVVNVRELLTSERNLSVELVATNHQRTKEILYELNSIGVNVEQMQLMNRERNRPFDEYGEEYTSEAEAE